MDIKKYKSSGILEQYVLGLATEEERQEVELYARAYPEIKEELDAIELAMEQYASGHQIPVPPGVAQKYNQQIDELAKANPTLTSKNNNNNPSGAGGIWLPLLLGIGLLGASLLAFSNYQSKQTSQTELTEVQKELTTLQTNCDETTQENNQLKGRLDILLNPDNKLVKMAGDNAIASVIWNETTKKSYLHINQLDAAPADKDYQLWALVDGKPVDMGIFKINVNEDGLQEVPFIENPGAFAVTLETAGGNPIPDLDALVMIGET